MGLASKVTAAEGAHLYIRALTQLRSKARYYSYKNYNCYNSKQPIHKLLRVPACPTMVAMAYHHAITISLLLTLFISLRDKRDVTHSMCKAYCNNLQTVGGLRRRQRRRRSVLRQWRHRLGCRQKHYLVPRPFRSSLNDLRLF